VLYNNVQAIVVLHDTPCYPHPPLCHVFPSERQTVIVRKEGIGMAVLFSGGLTGINEWHQNIPSS